MPVFFLVRLKKRIFPAPSRSSRPWSRPRCAASCEPASFVWRTLGMLTALGVRSGWGPGGPPTLLVSMGYPGDGTYDQLQLWCGKDKGKGWQQLPWLGMVFYCTTHLNIFQWWFLGMVYGIRFATLFNMPRLPSIVIVRSTRDDDDAIWRRPGLLKPPGSSGLSTSLLISGDAYVWVCSLLLEIAPYRHEWWIKSK